MSITVAKWLLNFAFFVLVPLALYSIHCWRHRVERLTTRRRIRGQCIHCGYDLRGSRDSMRCPECGEDFEILAKCGIERPP